MLASCAASKTKRGEPGVNLGSTCTALPQQLRLHFARVQCRGVEVLPLHARRICQIDRSDTRGLHSFIFQLNVSAFCGIGSAFRDCLGGVSGVSGGIRGCLRCVFVSETAQVELRSGRVSAPARPPWRRAAPIGGSSPWGAAWRAGCLRAPHPAAAAVTVTVCAPSPTVSTPPRPVSHCRCRPCPPPLARGLHSSTRRLNLSRFHH